MISIPEIDYFFSAIREDSRINPVHISLFMAIVQQWGKNNRQSPISVFSKELMQLAKISSIATYYRSMKQLHEYGYVKYKPSHNCYCRSLIYLAGSDINLKKYKEIVTPDKI